MARYRITVTFEDDQTNVVSGITIEEVLTIVLTETTQNDAVWFKIEELEE